MDTLGVARRVSRPALTLAGAAPRIAWTKGILRRAMGRPEAPIAQGSRVRMSISETSVRCAGQRFAISKRPVPLLPAERSD